VGVASRAIQTWKPQHDFVEQSSDDIWQACAAAVQAALVEGGVDLLMLETFGYVEELHQAVLASRDVNPRIPIIAYVTIDEDGNCLDGSDPEAFTARLEEWKVDVIGINCSVGPVAMLEAIAGRCHLESAYAAALEGGYLWHEFGDLHLILSD